MGIKSFLSRPLAAWVVARQNTWAAQPELTQKKIFNKLIATARNTVFGKDHGFQQINNYHEFAAHVPVRDYEGITGYIERVKAGEPDVLWPGKPIYFAKTSGTTSGTKYIPITKDSISNHINGAKDALLNYIHETKNAGFLNGRLIFLSGSPTMEKKNGIFIGRLSGIVNHHVPAYLKGNQLPCYETNCMDDWEAKVEKIVEETIHQPMTLISGIPTWVQMYFDKIQQKTNKKIKEVFPDFSLFVYGGVNFEPYKNKLFQSIGKEVDAIETYPASEGFIAFQNSQKDPALLLLLNSGIFYEFIPAGEYFLASPTRLTIGEIVLGVNYAIIINSNAGLWGYSLGDTVKFVSKNPYKLIVTGRIKHFISAFGEHVIGEEIEKAMNHALSVFPETQITEYTVAPQVNPRKGLPYHEWLIEFAALPNELIDFQKKLDAEMVALNIYYKDLINGNILKPLVITKIAANGFQDYMKSVGKLGGQNKVPRLSNDRNIADRLKLNDFLPTIDY